MTGVAGAGYLCARRPGRPLESRTNVGGGRCPAFILRSDTKSHLLNPALAELAAGPLTAHYSPLGAVVVSSPEFPNVPLLAISEGGRVKLDIRALQRGEFIRGCAAAGRLSASECRCAFAALRAQGVLEQRLNERVAGAIGEDQAKCIRGRAGSVG